tara:strand:+ start:9885 stop:10250 length:366 start_codon:yes stop_codon:yes gene_type:complete
MLSTSHRDRFRASPSPRTSRAPSSRASPTERARPESRASRVRPLVRASLAVVVDWRSTVAVASLFVARVEVRVDRDDSIARGNARASGRKKPLDASRVSTREGGDARGTEDGFVIVIDVTR